MKKIIYGLIIFWCFLFLFYKNVKAVTINEGVLELTYDEPLIPSTLVWYPGQSFSTNITVKNTDTVNHQLIIKADNTYETGNLASLFLYKITEKNQYVLGNDTSSIKSFWDSGEVTLSYLSPDEAKTYTITMSIPDTATDEHQGASVWFDYDIKFANTNSEIVIAGSDKKDPEPTKEKENNINPTIQSIVTKQCSVTAENIPLLLSADPGNNTVKITWQKVTDQITSYEVAYRIVPHEQTYTNESVDKEKDNFTINSLSANTNYCFKLRAINDCAQSEYSNQICATPMGLLIPTSTIAPGFTKKALSINSSPGNKGDVKGATTARNRHNYLWWIILIILVLISSVFYFLWKFWYSRKLREPERI